MERTDLMDEIERQRLMGDRLVAMRDYLVSFVERNYSLEIWDAEEVYSETCIYMLDRGYQLIRLDKDFDAAIMSTMKRRALNHLRGSKHRGNLQTTALAHINERSTLWSDRRNQEAEWIHEMDKAHLMGLAKSPLETVAMNHLLNHSNLRIRDTAREHGINYNTIHAGMRRMRAKLRDYLDD